MPCILTHDITVGNLGIKTAGGLVTTVVPTNSIMPVTRSLTFTTHQDNQTSVVLEVGDTVGPLRLHAYICSAAAEPLRTCHQVDCRYGMLHGSWSACMLQIGVQVQVRRPPPFVRTLHIELSPQGTCKTHRCTASAVNQAGQVREFSVPSRPSNAPSL